MHSEGKGKTLKHSKWTHVASAFPVYPFLVTYAKGNLILDSLGGLSCRIQKDIVTAVPQLKSNPETGVFKISFPVKDQHANPFKETSVPWALTDRQDIAEMEFD